MMLIIHYAIKEAATGFYLGIYPPIYPAGFTEDIAGAIFIEDREIAEEVIEDLEINLPDHTFVLEAYKLTRHFDA